MGKVKVFFLSFIITLAVLSPIYGGAYYFSVVRDNTVFANEVQPDVYVAQPVLSDNINVLVLVGEGDVQSASSYMLISFNAYANSISILCMPPETVMVLNKQPLTLKEATRLAGPSHAANAISETLMIEVEKYVFASPQNLWQTAEAFGNITMRVSQYVNEDSLSELGILQSNAQAQVLSPRFFAQVLSEGKFPQANEYEMRALGYSLFLSAGHGKLSTTLSDFITKNSTEIATNISADELTQLRRVWQFLDRQQPTYNAGALPGDYSNYSEEVYELNEESLLIVQEFGFKVGG